MAVSEFGRRKTHDFFKLPHKVILVLKPTLVGNVADGTRAIG